MSPASLPFHGICCPAWKMSWEKWLTGMPTCAHMYIIRPEQSKPVTLQSFWAPSGPQIPSVGPAGEPPPQEYGSPSQASPAVIALATVGLGATMVPVRPALAGRVMLTPLTMTGPPTLPPAAPGLAIGAPPPVDPKYLRNMNQKFRLPEELHLSPSPGNAAIEAGLGWYGVYTYRLAVATLAMVTGPPPQPLSATFHRMLTVLPTWYG